MAVLEADTVGSGASGRNGGFAMTLFGLTLTVTRWRFGPRRTREAQRYVERAVDYVGELVARTASAATQLNGRVLADLALCRESELTDVFFVNRRTIPWSPEPLRLARSRAILGFMHAETVWCDRRGRTG